MTAGALDALFGVDGKICVVTGASRGIGFHLARGLLEGGAARVYVASRKADDCDAAAAALGRYGSCISAPADLSTPHGRAAFVDVLREREPELHVLVNNAGATWGAPVDDYPESGIDKVLDVNVKAPFLLVQALLPLLRAAARPGDPARVVNLGSVDALDVPATENYAYSASKAAVHHLTRHLASALAVDGITVNAIAPGLFRSKMTEYLWTDGLADRAVSRIPLGREGGYEDAAGAMLYLASRAGAWLTGVVLPVAGGTATATPQLRRSLAASD